VGPRSNEKGCCSPDSPLTRCQSITSPVVAGAVVGDGIAVSVGAGVGLGDGDGGAVGESVGGFVGFAVGAAEGTRLGVGRAPVGGAEGGGGDCVGGALVQPATEMAKRNAIR
jgi:hypothetical protein